MKSRQIPTDFSKNRAPNSLVIRALGQDDLAPMDLLLLADPSEKQVGKYISDATILVVEESGSIVGVCALSELSLGTLEIHNIAVVESIQGKGIGTQLLNHAVIYAHSMNARALVIRTADTSVGQLHLYQKIGFEIESIDQDYFLKHYPQSIFENNQQCRDRLTLKMKFAL